MELRKERIEYKVPKQTYAEEQANATSLHVDLQGQQVQEHTSDSPLQAATKKLDKHMPKAFDGKYVEPQKGLQASTVETEYKQRIEESKFGKSGVHMLDTKFSLSKNAGPAITREMDTSGSEETKTIRRSAHNMLRICANYLKSKLQSWNDGKADPHDIVLTLRGTNKVAEATDLATRMIMDWMMENYKEHPEYANFIKFDLVKCNASTDEPTRRELDLNDEKKTHVHKDNISNTAIYSGAGFENAALQKVYGANKLILTESENPDDLVFSNKLSTIGNGVHFYTKTGQCEEIKSLNDFHEKLAKIENVPKHRKAALEDMAKKYFAEHNLSIDLNLSKKADDKEIEESKDKA